jgi:hypothetical protein
VSGASVADYVELHANFSFLRRGSHPDCGAFGENLYLAATHIIAAMMPNACTG